MKIFQNIEDFNSYKNALPSAWNIDWKMPESYPCIANLHPRYFDLKGSMTDGFYIDQHYTFNFIYPKDLKDFLGKEFELNVQFDKLINE